MLYTEVLAEILAITKRPDKVNAIRLKINSAISFYSLDNEFAQDFREEIVAIDPLEYTQAIALSTLTRPRKIKYIKRTGTNRHLTKLSDGELFKDCAHVDKWYIVGTDINIYTSVLCAGMDVGYYQYPPILTGTGLLNSYWLLDVAPWMIIDRVCSEIFRDIGEDKSSASHRQSAAEHYIAARKDFGISAQ